MFSCLVVLCAVFTAVSSNDLSAPVGGDVTFHCTHSFASGNDKYFCRDSCTDGKILIESSKRNPTRSGRYSLYDDGSEFRVTIRDLQLSDSGKYVCAVERFLKDTYIYMTLTVFEVTTLKPVPASSSRSPTIRTTRHTTENKGTSEKSTSSAPETTSPKSTHSSALSNPLVYVGLGLGALILLFTLVFFIFIKMKRKQKKRCAADEPIYLNNPKVSLASDGLNYSSVVFIRNQEKNRERESKTEDDLETLYSNISQPNATIYSTVNK